MIGFLLEIQDIFLVQISTNYQGKEKGDGLPV